jgi:hypothetical protein
MNLLDKNGPLKTQLFLSYITHAHQGTPTKAHPPRLAKISNETEKVYLNFFSKVTKRMRMFTRKMILFLLSFYNISVMWQTKNRSFLAWWYNILSQTTFLPHDNIFVAR